jgi:hypothetical protein
VEPQLRQGGPHTRPARCLQHSPTGFHAPTGLSQARPDAARTCRGTGGGLDIGRSV